MVIQLDALNDTIMSTGTSMDITETFRPDDITKTDFFDFVTANDSIGIGINDRVAGDVNGSNMDTPLQGFDQFWGAEKDVNRFESAIFEDLNRYCWNQQNNSSDLGSQTCNTDGQIYTLTVLNGNEPWLLSSQQHDHQQEPNLIQRKICDTSDETPAPALDFDSLLNTFPGYIKTEYPYEDSGFETDNKGEIILQVSTPSSSSSSLPQQQQQMQVTTAQQTQTHQPSLQQQSQQTQSHTAQSQPQQQQQQQISVTNAQRDADKMFAPNLNNTMNAAFHNNNNNDWQMADHNIIVEDGNETPESLLRSALQGKGYAKGMQNCITVIPSINSIKGDGADLRRAIFANDAQTTLTFADSTLNVPLFDENHSGVQSSNSSLPTSNQSDVTENGVIVDDMFLTLDSSFTDDFEKIKRIATDVQQFCIAPDEFSEIITEVAIQQPTQTVNGNGSLVATTTMPQQDIVTTSNSTLMNNSRPHTTTTATKTNKSPKKYKRSPNHNNNNNNNSINMNNNNLSANGNGMSLGTSVVNGQQQQRKERSLHYCSICSKGFKDKYSVNVHHRTHTGEKPFACSLCGKSFRQKAHLAKHYQTHLALKSTITTKGGAKNHHQQQQQQQQQQNNAHVVAPPPNILTNGSNIIR